MNGEFTFKRKEVLTVIEDYDTYLMHHGVKGMKWGVRRTPEQLERASKKKQEKKAEKAIKKDRKAASRSRRRLSDKELADRIKRLENEKKLKDLTKKDTQPGRQAVKKALKSVAKNPVVRNFAIGAGAYAVKVALTKQFDVKEAAAYVAPNPHKKKK